MADEQSFVVNPNQFWNHILDIYIVASLGTDYISQSVAQFRQN